jgi:integrase/recombinase XerD
MPPAHASGQSLYTQTGRRKYLTASERTRFIDAAWACARPELRTLCLTLLYTGCRISEALALRSENIETESGFIAITCLKKRSHIAIVREVPVPRELMEALAQVHCMDADNREQVLWTFSRSRAWYLVKTVMCAANIPTGPHMTPKGLRHGFGLHAIRSGVPLNLVQRWLGHARMETTTIYLQAVGEEEREFAALMWIR